MIIMVLAMIFSVMPIHGDDSGSIITVGMLEIEGYATQKEDGTYTGSDVEFAYKIAQYANLNIKIVLYQNGKECMDDFVNGRLDIMSNLFKTEERTEKFLFSDKEIGNLPLCVFTAEDDSRYSYNSDKQINTMTLGTAEGDAAKDLFMTWCASHDVVPHLKEYASIEDVKKAIDAGEIDGGIYSSPSVTGYRTIMTFSSQPYYFAFAKDRTALKYQIDDAMNAILTQDPLYRNKLVNRYAGHTVQDMEALTDEEKKYILFNPEVKIAVLTNDQPYYAKDSDGKDTGVLPALYSKVAVLTGLEFTYQAYDSEEDAVLAVKSGEADVLGLYSDGQIIAYNSDLRVTSPYADADAVLITHSGVSVKDINKIAVKERTQSTLKAILGSSIDADLVTYNNGAECFAALQKGEVDAMVCGQPSASWLINQNNASSYSVTTIASGAIEISGALAYDKTMLCTILSKAVTSVSYQFNELVNTNTLPSNDLKAMITRMSPAVLFGVACGLIALAIALISMIIMLVKHQKEKNALMQIKAENDRREIELSAAEKQTMEKNHFFSNISHDMRTPLNAIIGFSDLAYEEAASVKTKEYLKKIKKSGRLLNDMINDTLTISKINSGKMTVHLKAVNTDEIFDAICSPIQDMAVKKGITFTVDRTACPSRTVMADTLHLEKILLNLLTNAVKYTPAGGKVLLKVQTVPEEGKPTETIIQVIDNGIGISKEFLPHIYEPFLQEDNTGGESSGTGLGLSIVKNLVDIMHGSIEVESTKNQGTCFTLHFHFACAPESLPHKTVSQSDDILTGRRILLCEDNSLNREIAKEILQRKGMIIESAVNGEEGLQKYKASEEYYYDAILMDIRMPVMNGLDASRAIRRSGREDADTIPIIAMTANAFEDDIKQCLDAGMNAHVAKPIDPETMFRTIAANIHE
ncbi:MAG: transporter substrate-binding domain-containing protein [Solobacterium sp.]|jgi:signal transduction histidine kinase/ABC-type amino acid transport substrate-binding protein/ActR/RegA family two-component response regulator|nr:transporter substrate-binding domain-containing protein [Solobacterium sp.]MCH4206450.1 transporter substrate-binding domain-containing protein [Solobacterium sp.]MCH4227939.1 transporter substrate-binding domain-containing protein [Solobacterium sp.]